MLYLIGLGIDVKDISLKGLEAVKKCKHIYIEFYTSGFVDHVDKNYVSNLQKILKKKVVLVPREFVEDASVLLNESKRKNVALLVFGDPLSATTHTELLNSAKKMKVKYQVIHAPSILTAVSETGLQLYKFGKTASIAKWQPSFNPTSFYKILEDNQKINAHTLLLLDNNLNVKEAFSYIKKISEEKNDKFSEREWIVCSQLGTQQQKIKVDKIIELEKQQFAVPACIILPAKMHFAEEEYLESFT